MLRLRLDYAWNWFDLHAKQRMTLFYYFLIIAGILANALVATTKPSASSSVRIGDTRVSSIHMPNPESCAAYVAQTELNEQASKLPALSESASSQGAPEADVARLSFIRVSIGILGGGIALAFIVLDGISRRLNGRAEDVLLAIEKRLLFPDYEGLVERNLGIVTQELRHKSNEPAGLVNWNRWARMKWWIVGVEASVGLFFITSLWV